MLLILVFSAKFSSHPLNLQNDIFLLAVEQLSKLYATVFHMFYSLAVSNLTIQHTHVLVLTSCTKSHSNRENLLKCL